MKKDKIIYWVSTGIVVAMMLLSGVMYFAKPEIATEFVKMGYPNYFRIELGAAKLIGAIVLIFPQIPTRVKEWAYAGFGINFISAIIAHVAMNEADKTPMIFFLLILLVVSNIYLHKTKSAIA
ncbi:MAG TPA: DoxX family protein [Cytophaga sp.]|jgi:hypothetical protein|nr:DoxX family protein [Cytophaga sp.]